MSRLDDELRNAFRREQPSPDFTQRLLERVALQPLPKARWWQRLAMLLDPPKLRWVAIGVTASLLLAIGTAEYQRLNRVVVQENENNQQAINVQPAPAPVVKEDSSAKPTISDRQDFIERPSTIQKHSAKPTQVRHRLFADAQKAQVLKAEGEAAKEKLMAALAIASSVLSDAQKAVHDEGLTP